MTSIRASAPGKAVLSGEYAVLGGAPAIAVALDRRVAVEIAAGANEWHELFAPGLAKDGYRFRSVENFELEWEDPQAGAQFTLFASVWRVLRPSPATSLVLTIDSRELFDQGGKGKMGIGSSAAVAVALVGALRSVATTAGDTSALALAAHRDYQAGGSGIDVVTSCMGGVILFHINEEARRLDWPPGLHCNFFWSGVPADTVSRIAALSRTSANPDASGKYWRLQEAATAVADAWGSGNVAQILVAMQDYGAHLAAFGAASGIDIFGAGHDKIAALATEHSIVYKPCGAGGGDIGVAFADNKAALDVFAGQVAGHGFECLDLHPDARGLKTSEAP